MIMITNCKVPFNHSTINIKVHHIPSRLVTFLLLKNLSQEITGPLRVHELNRP